jgi:hypothetical protein
MPLQSSAVEDHPQRQAIIDALLAGESIRTVASRCVPPVSPASVQRYRAKVLKPAMRIARAKLQQVQQLGSNAQSPVELSRLQADLNHRANHAAQRIENAAGPLLDRLAKKAHRREEWFTIARAKQDTRGFAALDSVDSRDIELEAKLTGAIQTGESININVLVAVPAASTPKPMQSSQPVIIEARTKKT